MRLLRPTSAPSTVAPEDRYVAPAALVGKLTSIKPGIAFLGDSITAYNQNVRNAWHWVLAWMAGLRHDGWFASGGFTLAQIQATHLPQLLALSPLPGAVVIAGGTNDVGASGYDFAASRATHTAIVNSLIAVGIMPVLWCLPPRDDDTNVNLRVGQWNAWIRGRAIELGVPVVDAWTALVNPATGLYTTALRLDQVHPNGAGHAAIGRQAATDTAFLARFAAFRPHITASAVDGANLLPSGQGLHLNDANSDGIADGWGKFSSPVCSVVAGDTSIRGNWQRISVASGVAPSGGLQYVVTGIVPGRRYAMRARLRADLDPAGTITAGLSGDWRDASAAYGTTQLRATGVQATDGAGWSGIIHGEGVCPAGADRIRLTFSLAGTAPAEDVWADIAQVTITDMTTVGLAA